IRPGLTTATHSSGLPLPLPIRVSAGFFVTGLSGNTRIHTLPPRLRLRVSATRAASIWRLVTQPRSSALSPYSPNVSVEPRGAEPQRGRHRLLHGAPEGHALLELQRDVLGHELRVQLGMDDLLDVEVDLLARPRLQLVLQLLHLGALAADDDAGPRREDGDARAVRRPLDVDLRDAGVVELVLDEAPDLDVLVEKIRVVLRGEPARRPRARAAEAEADRMRLLTHRLFLLLGLASAPCGRLLRRRLGRGRLRGGRRPARGRGRRPRRRPGRAGGRRPQGAARLVADADGEMAGAVPDGEGASHRPGLHALHRGTAVGDRLHPAQVVEVPDLVAVL